MHFSTNVSTNYSPNTHTPTHPLNNGSSCSLTALKQPSGQLRMGGESVRYVDWKNAKKDIERNPTPFDSNAKVNLDLKIIEIKLGLSPHFQLLNPNDRDVAVCRSILLQRANHHPEPTVRKTALTILCRSIQQEPLSLDEQERIKSLFFDAINTLKADSCQKNSPYINNLYLKTNLAIITKNLEMKTDSFTLFETKKIITTYLDEFKTITEKLTKTNNDVIGQFQAQILDHALRSMDSNFSVSTFLGKQFIYLVSGVGAGYNVDVAAVLANLLNAGYDFKEAADTIGKSPLAFRSWLKTRLEMRCLIAQEKSSDTTKTAKFILQFKQNLALSNPNQPIGDKDALITKMISLGDHFHLLKDKGLRESILKFFYDWATTDEQSDTKISKQDGVFGAVGKLLKKGKDKIVNGESSRNDVNRAAQQMLFSCAKYSTTDSQISKEEMAVIRKILLCTYLPKEKTQKFEAIHGLSAKAILNHIDSQQKQNLNNYLAYTGVDILQYSLDDWIEVLPPFGPEMDPLTQESRLQIEDFFNLTPDMSSPHLTTPLLTTPSSTTPSSTSVSSTSVSPTSSASASSNSNHSGSSSPTSSSPPKTPPQKPTPSTAESVNNSKKITKEEAKKLFEKATEINKKLNDLELLESNKELKNIFKNELTYIINKTDHKTTLALCHLLRCKCEYYIYCENKILNEKHLNLSIKDIKLSQVYAQNEIQISECEKFLKFMSK